MIAAAKRSSRAALKTRFISTVSSRKRTVQLDNLSEPHVDTNAYTSFFLESLHLDRQQRRAILKFFHPEDASFFVTKVIPAWKHKSSLEVGLVDEAEETIPPVIPAAIHVHGLTRSLHLDFRPSMRLANFRQILERVGPHEVVTEGKNADGTNYWVVQFFSIQDALKAYNKWLAEELRGVQNAAFVAPQHGSGKRATTATLPTSRRIIIDDIPLGATLSGVYAQLRLPPIAEDISIDTNARKLAITFMSSLSVQEFIKANPSKQVTINKASCSFATQPLPASAPGLVSATRLGASRTLSLSGMHSEIRDTSELEKRLRQLFEHFGPVVDVTVQEGYRSQATVVFSSIDAACRAVLQFNRKKKSPRNKYDNVVINFAQDDTNADYDLPSKSLLHYLYEEDTPNPNHGPNVPLSTLASLLNQAELGPPKSESQGWKWE